MRIFSKTRLLLFLRLRIEESEALRLATVPGPEFYLRPSQLDAIADRARESPEFAPSRLGVLAEDLVWRFAARFENRLSVLFDPEDEGTDSRQMLMREVRKPVRE